MGIRLSETLTWTFVLDVVCDLSLNTVNATFYNLIYWQHNEVILIVDN